MTWTMNAERDAKARVLVVDDEPASRSGLVKLLRLEGYHVDEAADGQQALVMVIERAPDVVITDLRMPNMDGVALLTKLREHVRDVPAVILSGSGDDGAPAASMRAGAVSYLTKPADFDALLVAIEGALARSRDSASLMAGGR